MELAQITAIIINVLILSLTVGGTGILIKKLKLASRNEVLLFILFIFYWMAPLFCREYTGQMHIAINNAEYGGDRGIWFWLPLTIYGLAGLLYRPLTDVISYKTKSRKYVIYLSLLIQFGTLLPMFLAPNNVTNIIQSVGTGVGASIIGIFNLMFVEKDRSAKIFKLVSIVAIPPAIAEIVTSCGQSIACSFLPDMYEVFIDPTLYIEVMKYLWICAVVTIMISFFLTTLVQENRQQIFKSFHFREPVKTKHDWSVIVLVGLAAMCLGFVRWITSGPTSITQLVFLAEVGTVRPNLLDPQPYPIKYFEGYFSLMYAVGQLAGTAIVAAALSKKQKTAKWVIVLSGCLVWALNLSINTIESEYCLNAAFYFATNILNGLAFGLILPVLIGVMVNKHFFKTNIITPVGVFNTCLAAGITLGSAFNCIYKGPIFDIWTGWDINLYAQTNHLINMSTFFVVAAMAIIFIAAYAIHAKHPPRSQKVGIDFALASEMEI